MFKQLDEFHELMHHRAQCFPCPEVPLLCVVSAEQLCSVVLLLAFHTQSVCLLFSVSDLRRYAMHLRL